MDGTGQEQDRGQTTGHPLPEDARIDDVPETLRDEKGTGEEASDREGGGRLATNDGKQAVRNQSVVSPDDYAGSSESGV